HPHCVKPYPPTRYLRSFPTRRSSDLRTVPGRAWLRPPTKCPGLAGPAPMIRRHGKGLRRRRWHELRERRSKGIFLLPSLLTTGNLFCGFFALLLTVENRYTEAALAIFVAMLMDIL